MTKESFVSLSTHVNRWQSLVGRNLTSFEQLKIARPFRYDGVNNRWYRLLKPVLGSLPYGFVEIDLTIRDETVPNHKVFAVNVHSTSPTGKDVFSTNLPDVEFQRMARSRGLSITQWVLYSDLWSGLDLDRLVDLRSHNSYGSIPLASLLKPESCHDDLFE
jgi:hypothetical protein